MEKLYSVLKNALVVLLVISANYTFAQVSVTGTVTDQDGPIASATVAVKGTTTGTTTNANGKYSINAPEGAVLTFSFIGYTTKDVTVGTQKVIDVILTANARQLENVVVTSLGIKREQKSLGYSVSTVTAKELTQAGNTNFGSALYGKAAGVRVTTAPGGASGAVNIQIRGINSLNFQRQPLYVVDGVIIRNDQQNGTGGANNNNFFDDQRIRGNGMLDINPADIENITILKGASASALYGSDAASGVIVITTKKGIKGRGLGIDFNYAGSLERAAFLPKYQKIYGPGYDRETNISVGADAEGWIPDATSPSGRRPFYRAYAQFGPKFDGSQVRWWDGSIRTYSPQDNNYADVFDKGYSHNYNLSISNQTDKINYRLSATRLDYKGTNPGSNQQRNTFNYNSSIKIAPKLTADVVVSYVNTITHNRPYLLGQVLGSYGGFFNAAEDMNILRSLAKTSQGYKYSTIGSGRPEAFLYSTRPTNLLDFYWNQLTNNYDEKENRLLTSATLNWDVVNHVKLRTRIGNDYTAASSENKMYNEYATSFNPPSNSTGGYAVTKGLYSILYGDALLTYSNKLNTDFEYSASGGFQFRNENYNDQSSSTTAGLVTENFFSLSNTYAQAGTTATRASQLKYAYIGILNLNYKNFLYAEGTARQEYSSTLPPTNNEYFYTSVNTGFVFSEAFKLPEFITYGKLRASYGIVGNDAARYSPNVAYQQSSLATINGAVPALTSLTSYGNPNLKPERKYEQEYGAEFKFFKSRVGFDVSYYTNKIKNQILDLQVAPTNGAYSQIVNVGEIANNGVEVSLNGTPISTKDFKWAARLNYSFNKSKVVSLAPGVNELLFYQTDNAIRVVAGVGETLGNIYVLPIATNSNGDKLIDDDGYYTYDTKYVKVGNIMPKAIGGLTNTFTYKNFSLDITADYRIGGQMVSAPTKYALGSGLYESTLQYRDAANGGLTYNQGGVTYNDGVLLPGVNANTGQPNTRVIDAANYYLNTYSFGPLSDNATGAVFDNSYIKVREATLSYLLPSVVASKIHFNNLRISLIGRNLFYIWKTLKYFDPEAPVGNKWWSQGVDVGSTAPTRSIGISLNASF